MPAGYLGSQEISEITKVTFSGSSSPVTKTMPKCKGALLKPSNKAERNISLYCYFGLAEKTKTQIEELHHDLNEELAARANQNLSVNGNIYEGVVARSTQFDIKALNEFFDYTITFGLHHSQGFSQTPGLKFPQTRSGWFRYQYGDADQELSEFRFHILHNYEVGIPCNYTIKEKTRVLREFGRLNCWLVNTPTKDIESYFFNYIAGVGPLGKQGTLNLNGNEFKKAIMTGFSQSDIKSNSNADGTGGSNVYYDIEFQVSLQC